FEAGKGGHIDIHENNMRSFGLRQFYRLLCVAALRNHLEPGVTVQDVTPGLPDQFVVVSNQDIDLTHIGLFYRLFIGTCTRNLQPSPGADWMVTLPPKRPARLVILDRPNPFFPAFPGSNPLPSSVMLSSMQLSASSRISSIMRFLAPECFSTLLI